jgi:PKD repeat protein
MYWITDRTVTTAALDSTAGYNGGDFGGHLVPGETYYFSVTAMYQPYQPVAGNAVRLTFPGGATPTPTVTVAPDLPVALPDQGSAPTDPDGDGLYEDLSGNGEAGFSDVVLFFKNIDWIAENEPVPAFDFSGNGEIGFNDIVGLFREV